MQRHPTMIRTILLLYLIGSLLSCQTPAPAGKLPENAPSLVLRDFGSWYQYHETRVRLAQDFRARDSSGAPMAPLGFLQALAAGHHIAIRTSDSAGKPVYRLYPLPDTCRDIRATLQQLAGTELRNRAWEGRLLPPFDFTDLQGRHYTDTATRGKILLLKGWFINCLACVQEFPELNKLVERYEKRDDVLFLSLARDPAPALRAFLQRLPFRYATVADQTPYLEGKLGIDAYPTHLLVDAQGKVRKVTQSLEDLLPWLRQLAQETPQNAAMPE